MNEIELRKYCLDKAIEILGWYKNFFPKKELHPLIISEILYRYYIGKFYKRRWIENLRGKSWYK